MVNELRSNKEKKWYGVRTRKEQTSRYYILWEYGGSFEAFLEDSIKGCADSGPTRPYSRISVE